MKKTTLLYFLSLFFISSFSGFSQTVLYSETFDASSINATTLNDSGVSDYNAHSWTDQAYLYKFNHTDHEEPNVLGHWLNASAHASGEYGNNDATTGMTGYRAGIQAYGTYWYNGGDDQYQSLITPTVTATATRMTVSFIWTHRSYNDGDSFSAVLQHRSGDDDFVNLGAALVSQSGSSGYYGATYSGTITVVSGG